MDWHGNGVLPHATSYPVRPTGLRAGGEGCHAQHRDHVGVRKALPTTCSACLLSYTSLTQNTTTDGAVGDPVYAYHNAADVAVTFLIAGGNDTLSLFKINFCSGQLRMQTSGLSALTTPYYRLLVEVRSNSDSASAAQANVTVVVLPVPHPPQFADSSYTRSVLENATIGSTILPCALATDPDFDNLTFSLAPSATSLGLVNVTASGVAA